MNDKVRAAPGNGQTLKDKKREREMNMEKKKSIIWRKMLIGLAAICVIVTLLPQTLTVTFADDDPRELCGICLKLRLKDDLCPDCGTCPYCIASQEEIHCDYCGACATTWDAGDPNACAATGTMYCEECLKEEGLHCKDCGQCFCNDQDSLCEECGLCKECCEADSEGNKFICGACTLCSGCSNHCPECGDCEYDRCPAGLAHCLNECELCPNCEEICFYDGEYELSEDDPCEYCGLCEECCAENQCPDCGMCAEDPLYDTHFCANCGECLEVVGEVCDNCGLCYDCCRLEAECMGCTCGEFCFEELDETHVCENCGLCFGEVAQCPTCLLCVDCCRDVSIAKGCDCKTAVCVNSDEWEEHVLTFHGDFVAFHVASPSSTWSFDNNSHWKECKYCEDKSHYTDKKAHALDKNGRCTTCGYSKNLPIVIYKQPKSAGALVSNDGADEHDDWYRKNNVVRFSISAGGKDLTYRWYLSHGRSDLEWFESLRKRGDCLVDDEEDGRGHRGSATSMLFYSVDVDDCPATYYLRCLVSDGENFVWSEPAVLDLQHNFTLFDPQTSEFNERGHYLTCHGCYSETKFEPHVYDFWVWEDEAHTRRSQTCKICGAVNEVYIHNHNVMARQFYFGNGYFEDANHYDEFDPGTGVDNWRYTGTIGTKNFRGTCIDLFGNEWKVDWNYHTGWCYCDDCHANPVKVRESHHFNSWQGSDNPPTHAGETAIIWRECGDCGYVQYASIDDKPVQWGMNLHPVNYFDCNGSAGFVKSGDVIRLYPKKVEDKVQKGWKIRYWYLNAKNVYVWAERTLGADADSWTVPGNKVLNGAGKIEIYQTFENTPCAHPETELINEKPAPCGRRGYTGDQVCTTCGKVIVQGEPTQYRSHGTAVSVTKDVYKTNSKGETVYDRYGNPLIEARGPHAADCKNKINGNEADKICSECGKLVERGKTLRWEDKHVRGASLTWVATYECTDSEHPATDKYKCLDCGEFFYLKNPDLNEWQVYDIEMFWEYHPHAELINKSKAMCTAFGYEGEIYCPDCREILCRGDRIAPSGHKWDEGVMTLEPTENSAGRLTCTCETCGATKTFFVDKKVRILEMHRLYNPNSGEHFYTSGLEERDTLMNLGWQYEGIAWNAPEVSDTPVYRLYNPNAGDHHYTPSEEERDMLVNAGWNMEGIGWYSDDAEGVPLHRLYNPNAECGAHHYTTSEEEKDNLINAGWRYEGVGWYGVKSE